jgi:hypothetical protein
MRVVVLLALDIKQDPISEITRVKRAGDMAQAIKHSLSKSEALISPSSTSP